MPLSKKRNRDRMRQSRLHKASLPPQDIKSVQPDVTLRQPSPLRDAETRASGGAYEEPLEHIVGSPVQPEIDADGNIIPGYE